jgi:hydroxymethylglutaryl-CoA reductase
VETNTDFTGYHKLTPEGRIELLRKASGLNDGDLKELKDLLIVAKENEIDWMENQISAFVLPLAIVPNFVVNGRNYLIPMVTEETGIIAACSFAAKVASKNGGFFSRMVEDRITGQVVCDTGGETHEVDTKIQSIKNNLIEQVNNLHPALRNAGGGLIDIRTREVTADNSKEYLCLDIIIDAKDAMGAALATTMAEEVTSIGKELLDDRVLLRVISNDMSQRICECEAVFDEADLGGTEVAERIGQAYEYAKVDPSRAITHNKGIMNGIIAFTTAMGNDTRAMEAGAHFLASSSGKYQPLSSWSYQNHKLKGKLSIPVPLGSVGGATRASKISRLCFKILGVNDGVTIREIGVAVGLAANLGVLRALVTTGIGKSHRDKKT